MKFPLATTERPGIVKTRFASPEMLRRTAHGGMAWVTGIEEKLHQPQDGALEARGRVADITSRKLRVSGEPEDARITGGTRSLMRRLSGLNMMINTPRPARPVAAKSIIQNLQLTNANVA